MDNSFLFSHSRRKFLASTSVIVSGLFFDFQAVAANVNLLEVQKAALPLHHFPSTLHALIWRNWYLVPLDRMASVARTSSETIRQIGTSMGLPPEVEIPKEQQNRSYLTVIRRNWHLLPREQMLELLGWTDKQLSFTLQEDDFFYIKLGHLKPDCSPVHYKPEHLQQNNSTNWFSKVLKEEFSEGIPSSKKPLFHFVEELSQAPKRIEKGSAKKSGFSPRFGYAYFALFGDPLLEPEIDPYPSGYLERMADSGMDGTWLHIVLSKLTPFPWDASLSSHHETRLANLKKLVDKTATKGINIYLYLNEPRFMPLDFFRQYPDLKGVTIGDKAALCTSHPEVQQYLVDSLAMITEAVPHLGGFFSITASENHSHCWSYGRGGECPRCASRGPEEVISELHMLYRKGINQGLERFYQKHPSSPKKSPQLIVWDWGWADGWAEKIIPQLPKDAAFMSVSEWGLEFEKGGTKGTVGEYSISNIGPGPRASKHWGIARENGLKTIAKIQAGTTWEIGAVPYIPALENVAQHAVNLRDAQVDGLMLGWTLGGYPSPNLEIVAAIGNQPELTVLQAMEQVSQERVGPAGKAMVRAWQRYSRAFREFPFDGSVVYNAPLQAGPSNLLWESPTGYSATMVGLAYDDINSWRSHYPLEVFISQLEKVAVGFEEALEELRNDTENMDLSTLQRIALDEECQIAEAISIHYFSIVHQARFTSCRDRFQKESDNNNRRELLDEMEKILKEEIHLAKRMNILQGEDPRLGFEATNHYFYTPIDLVEKVFNCRDLLDRWIPSLRKSV